MNEYAKNNMKPISVPRGFMTHATEITPSQLAEVMSVNGKIGWLGGNGRPDLGAGHSIIAGGYKTMSPELITQCNQCVKQALDTKVSIKVHPIAVEKLRMVCFCDSSFDHNGERHQQG